MILGFRQLGFNDTQLRFVFIQFGLRFGHVISPDRKTSQQSHAQEQKQKNGNAFHLSKTLPAPRNRSQEQRWCWQPLSVLVTSPCRYKRTAVSMSVSSVKKTSNPASSKAVTARAVSYTHLRAHET